MFDELPRVGGCDSVHVRAIDGSRITLESTNLLEPAAPATSYIRVDPGGGQLEFTSGNRQFGELFARYAAGIELTERFKYQRGELRIGFGEDTGYSRACVGVWEGPASSLFLYTGNNTTEQMIARFDLGVIEEVDERAVLHPKSTVQVVEPATVIQELSGIGILGSKRMNTDVVARLPSWRGTRVAGGELFKEDYELPDGSKSTVLYLVNEKSASQIMPRTRECSEGDLLERVGRIEVDWSD